jgi:hypothetical protein
MKQVKVRIRGISPLLMHRFPLEPVEALEKRPPEEQARIALYERENARGGDLHRPVLAAQGFSLLAVETTTAWTTCQPPSRPVRPR